METSNPARTVRRYWPGYDANGMPARLDRHARFAGWQEGEDRKVLAQTPQEWTALMTRLGLTHGGGDVRRDAE